MENLSHVLSKCPLFTDIKEQDYSSLLSCMNSHVKNFDSHEHIFNVGDIVNHVGIVISGSLEIIKENLAGAKHIIAFLENADIFGEGIVCTHKRVSPITLKVKEPSRILFIDYERITKSCGSSCLFHTQLIENMMMILGEKNYSLNHKIDILMIKGMREKLAAYFINEVNQTKSLTFQTTPNRNELSEYLNVSRTSMCRELSKMKDEKLIDYYQNSFKILNIDKLKGFLT